jgi:aspartate racemase
MSNSPRTIGIVGGMSWASTMTYYRVVSEEIIRITRGRSCGSVHIVSFDSSEIERFIEEQRWQTLANKIAAATHSLVEMGSDIVLVASNTAHLAFEHCPAALHERTIHIADALVERLTALGATCPGFLGTSTTLSNLTNGRLVRMLGYDPVLPPSNTWSELDRMIFTRLCRGVVLQADKKTLESIIDDMSSRGAKHIILGCTEIGLLFSPQQKESMGLLDSAEVHASVAARHSVANFSECAPFRTVVNEVGSWPAASNN